MRGRTCAIGAAFVTVLAVGAAACTGGSGPEGGAAGADTGTVGSATSPLQPGRYRDLPEPCGMVGTDVLRAMLPGAEGQDSPREEDGEPRAYEGEPTLTYDTDRRAGCRWESSTSLGSRHLLVDLERVVSYDSAVSDEERAEALYEGRAQEAGVPEAAPGDDGAAAADTAGGADDPGASGGTPRAPGGGEDGGEPSEAGSPSGAEGDGGSAEPDAPAPSPTDAAEPVPRPLDGVGDAAYLDDELVTAGSDVHRDVTLVFRAANVLVTVRYEQWVTDDDRLPDSAELQEKAHRLARELAGGLEG